MLQKIAALLRQIAGPKTFVLALLTTALLSFYVMPKGAKVIAVLAKHEVKVFDLQLGYSPAQARTILAAYTDEARKMAAMFGYMADTVYPVSYTFLYIIAIAWVFKNIRGLPSAFQMIHLFPVLALLSDLCENAFVGSMLLSYPDLSNATVYIASFFTSTKWLLIALQTILLLGGSAYLARQRLQPKA